MNKANYNNPLGDLVTIKQCSDYSILEAALYEPLLSKQVQKGELGVLIALIGKFFWIILKKFVAN